MWVNSCNLTNDDRHHYPFQVVLIYWLMVKYQYVNYFLQQGVQHILREMIHCIIHTETCKSHLKFIDRHFKLFISLTKRFLHLTRSLCDQSFLVQELQHCKPSPLQGYLTVVNYRLFPKAKMNSFSFKNPVLKILHEVWFTSFSVNYAMNLITENMLDILP